MSESAQFIIGSNVVCRDGHCGVLHRVVVDPVIGVITHLVVEPRHRRTGGRLVPVALAISAGETIRLDCTVSDFHALDDADETQLLPGAAGQWEFEQADMRSLPYYPLASSDGVAEGGPLEIFGGRPRPYLVTSDRVPAGEVEVRRGDEVYAKDGVIGRVKGLVVDPGDHHVTHLLLDEGHLWGRKIVAIPISAVTRHGDHAYLDLTKDEVRELPPVAVARVD